MKPIKLGVVSETNIVLSQAKLTYAQNADTWDPNSDSTQELEIEAHVVGPDESFFTLKSDRWAFDNSDELLGVIKDFKQKILSGNK